PRTLGPDRKAPVAADIRGARRWDTLAQAAPGIRAGLPGTAAAADSFVGDSSAHHSPGPNPAAAAGDSTVAHNSVVAAAGGFGNSRRPGRPVDSRWRRNTDREAIGKPA